LNEPEDLRNILVQQGLCLGMRSLL